MPSQKGILLTTVFTHNEDEREGEIILLENSSDLECILLC